MKNIIWYFGFLSLLSLLFFVEGKTAFLWFIAFIAYFSIYRETDERLELNLGKATRNSFVYTIIFGGVSIAYIYLTQNIELFAPAFVIIIGGSLFVCLMSLLYYEKISKR